MVRCVPCRIADKKRSSRPAYRDERKLPRYHPNSARARRTLCAVTGGPAGDWPELTGEQSTFLAGRSQPMASLSGAEPWYYFPDPSNKLNNKAIYTTLCGTNQCKRGRKFDAARRKRYNNQRKITPFPSGRQIMHRIAPCAPYLPRRASDTNKYDYGRVLIVGGCI